MSSIVITVRGMPVTCWKCKKQSGAVVALHPADNLDLDGGCWHADEPALALARELLLTAGQCVVAGQLVERFSRTIGASYLSNGCHHCSALFGTFFLTEDITGTAVSATQSFADFVELARGTVDSGRWACLLEDRTMVLG